MKLIRSIASSISEVQTVTSKLACSVLRASWDRLEVSIIGCIFATTEQGSEISDIIFRIIIAQVPSKSSFCQRNAGQQIHIVLRLELCRILTAALCGHQDFSLELDEASPNCSGNLWAKVITVEGIAPYPGVACDAESR